MESWEIIDQFQKDKAVADAQKAGIEASQSELMLALSKIPTVAWS